ncbi:MAG: ADP-ribosylglycohydrolase family protein [Gemmatimonadota bacterium]|nr:ADP-ribosylglycohydrolase family protein [Gemmatimonadota bacterium]
MWGAIIGDIVGSVYEGRGRQIKTKHFEFFNPHGRITDDSVCTAAIADILLNGRPAATTLQEWCRQYPMAGYGGWFIDWMRSAPPEPYNSFGNGAAMRVSPAALIHRDNLSAALAATDQVTAVTHDHPEGIKGARATIHAIWLALRETEPSAIRAAISAEYGYDLSRTVDRIRPGYSFDVTCQGTVPEAITCALESTSFEDAIRNAVSLGGDSDTLAAIAGPIAEARHGIPDDTREFAERHYLSGAPDIAEILDRLYAKASLGR